MQMNINFPAEVESALKRRAAAAGQDVATFVQQIVAEELASDEQAKRPRRSPEEFRQSLHEIIDRHTGSRGRMDDSRESIYAGRGE
jgi:hypothetical protein